MGEPNSPLYWACNRHVIGPLRKALSNENATIADKGNEVCAQAYALHWKTIRNAERCTWIQPQQTKTELEKGNMKIFLDLAAPDSPVHKAIKQVFTTVGELEFVSTVVEADGIITDEPEKVQVYLEHTSKRVAQVLWWKQKPAALQSDRLKVFDALPSANRGSLPSLIEAITFLKGS
jgi:hypothetical protein